MTLRFYASNGDDMVYGFEDIPVTLSGEKLITATLDLSESYDHYWYNNERYEYRLDISLSNTFYSISVSVVNAS